MLYHVRLLYILYCPDHVLCLDVSFKNIIKLLPMFFFLVKNVEIHLPDFKFFTEHREDKKQKNLKATKHKLQLNYAGQTQQEKQLAKDTIEQY